MEIRLTKPRTYLLKLRRGGKTTVTFGQGYVFTDVTGPNYDTEHPEEFFYAAIIDTRHGSHLYDNPEIWIPASACEVISE